MSGTTRTPSEALREGLALLAPRRAAIAEAAGLREDTLYQYLNGRRTPPPAVQKVFAQYLREQSRNLLVAAAGLEAKDLLTQPPIGSRK